MTQKRKLHFADLHQAMVEAERLLESGYQSAGNWNLSQCCGHLSEWLRYPIDGFPQSNIVVRALMWMMKVTIGKKQFQSVLQDGFKDNIPTMPSTVPAPNAAEDRAALATLKATVERFASHDGELHPSPFYGPMTKEQGTQLQLRHFEHHLGFLIPNE